MSQATDWGVPTAAQAPKTPEEMAVAMNDSFNAALSSHGGTSRPSYAIEGTIWVDQVSSTIRYINYYDGAHDIRVATYNPTDGTLTYINIPDAFISLSQLKADIFNALSAVSADTDDYFIVIDSSDSNNTKKLKVSDVINAASSPPPVGAIMPYGGGTAPTGYLLCDGSEYSRTTYSDLYAVLLTTFGAGDGSTTFNVPDLQGRAPIGQGTGASLTERDRGTKLGEETHKLTIAEMPAHAHVYTRYGSGGTQQGSPGGSLGGSTPNTSSVGGSDAHNNMQPSLVTNYIIKY